MNNSNHSDETKNNSCTIIQRAFRIHRLRKTVQELDKLMIYKLDNQDNTDNTDNQDNQDNSFNYSSIKECIISHYTIRETNKLFKTLFNLVGKSEAISGNKLRNYTRVFLTSFMIKYVPSIIDYSATEDTNAEDDELLENRLYHKTIQLHDYLRKILDCVNKRISNTQLFLTITRFIFTLTDYISLLEKWKAYDKIKIIRELITVYYEVDDFGKALLSEIESGEETDESKLELNRITLEQIENEKISIKSKIESIDPENGLNYFKTVEETIENYAQRKADLLKTLEENIRNQMYAAFYDNIKSSLNNKEKCDYTVILPLLESAIDFIKKLVPNSKEINDEIQEYLDIDFIKQKIENDVVSHEDVYQLMVYLITLLERLQARNYDNETREWKKELERKNKALVMKEEIASTEATSSTESTKASATEATEKSTTVDLDFGTCVSDFFKELFRRFTVVLEETRFVKSLPIYRNMMDDRKK